MYVEYGNLINFANSVEYNNMYESRLQTLIYNWIGEAKDDITSDYWFTVTFQFNDQGLAVDAEIKVQVRSRDGEWESLGSYSPFGNVKLSDVIGVFNESTCEECIPSDFPSDTEHYYITGYYVEGYYV